MRSLAGRVVRERIDVLPCSNLECVGLFGMDGCVMVSWSWNAWSLSPFVILKPFGLGLITKTLHEDVIESWPWMY